jgi:DMSO/TMAO reductase YedYZ molybdopterin-dependent catalytic subunit
MKPGLIVVGFLILLITVVWIMSLYGTPSLPNIGSNTLSPVEVHEYEGTPLGSTQDFRENSIKGPRTIDPLTYHLSVTGLVNHPLVLSYNETITSFPSYRKVVTIHCVEGWDVTILWEGILVRDILNRAQIKPSANTVIFHADDGYTTSFPLVYLTDNPIIMAFQMNNMTLPRDRGFPFQLVAEDKWGYKWAKWITGIEVTDDPSYEGYWESRGFAQNGDLDHSFYG